MTLLDTLLANRGETRDSIPRNSRTGKALRRKGVPACAEFQRIDALPRRVWTDEPDIEEQIELMTQWLRTPQGAQRLWPIQAIALREIADNRGLIGGVRVSGGKTLIAMLAATVLELPRPMVFVPAKSINSGKVDKAYREAREHWRVRDDIQFVSYERLQQLEYEELLLQYRPGIVIADEAHKWRNDSARAARTEKFVELHPDVPFVLLSGTFMAAHIVKDVAKLCDWGLRERSPLPRHWKAQKDWADALEVNPKFDPTDPESRYTRMAPGALERWCVGDEAQSLDGLRQAFGRRYTETPGVIVSSGDALGQSLVIDVKVNPTHNEAVEAAFVELRGNPHAEIPPKAPDGWVLVDAPVIWTLAQCLELGFYYKAEPRPPVEWTLARQNWASYCREVLKGDPTGSELKVANACRELQKTGEAPDEWLDWMEQRPTFQLNVVPVWLSDERVQAAAKWLKRHKGLVWTQFRAFGERLSQVAGVPFFSAEACDIEGNSIVDYPGGGAIVSFQACSEDLNLQDRWHSNLYVCPPSSGQQWEQSLARTHRFGQTADEVSLEVWVGCIENHESIDKALEKERAVALAGRDDARKMLVAEWCGNRELPNTRSRRWRKP